MDEDIEGVTKRCEGCQGVANNPKQAPLHRWEYPAYPWQRLHIDFAGPFQGKMFLVVVDAHTKWPDMFEMQDTTAAETVATLRSLFARRVCQSKLCQTMDLSSCLENSNISQK